jgi:hypothetical protein
VGLTSVVLVSADAEDANISLGRQPFCFHQEVEGFFGVDAANGFDTLSYIAVS